MFYREGMPGSILFTAVAMVIYFVVGIRYADIMLANTPTSVGKFTVLLLIQLFSTAMVWVYCKDRHDFWKLLAFCCGITVIALLFSIYVIPFDIVWIQLVVTCLLIGYLLWQGLGTRLRNYYWIALFALGSSLFFSVADYGLNHVLQPH